MKHIFVVHSNITYLSALGVIAKEGLAEGDYLLVSQGAFMRSEPVATVRLPYFSGLKANRFDLKSYLNPCRAADQTIDAPFTAYISTLNPLARCLITHPHCAAFHFIEEGLQSYVSSFDLRSMTLHNAQVSFRSTGLRSRFKDLKWPFLRGYTSRISALPLFYNAYNHPSRHFYGYHADSFCLIAPSSRRLISFDQITDRFSFSPQLDLTGSIIWLGDCVEGGQSWAQYLEAIEQGFIEAVLKPRHITQIKLKHHYREQQPLRKATLALFARHGIAVELIPDAVVMEVELAATKTPVELHGTYSSLLVYAAFAGHRAFSVDRHYAGGVQDDRFDFLFSLVERT